MNKTHNREIFLIYGVPGVGKTHFSRNLQTKTGFGLIELDRLRDLAQNGTSQTKEPFLFSGTTEAFNPPSLIQ